MGLRILYHIARNIEHLYFQILSVSLKYVIEFAFCVFKDCRRVILYLSNFTICKNLKVVWNMKHKTTFQHSH